MRNRAALLVTIGLVPFWPAMAQERPPDVPTRDVSVTYQVQGGQPGGGPQTIRMTYKAAGDKMRIDEDHVESTIMDGSARRTLVLNNQQRIYFQVPYDPEQERGAMPPGLNFSRAGNDTVAGLPCTVWRAQQGSNSSTACLTADGVMLRTEEPGPGGAAQRMVATSVDYAPQPDGLFVPPAGYRRVQPPAMPQGGGPGGPGGPQGGPPGGPMQGPPGQQ
jgi:hypothetical protein